VLAVDIVIPTFGYQSHVGIDRGFGFIRTWKATDAAAYEGRVLREGPLDKTNTAGRVWADTAYRSKANEAFMALFIRTVGIARARTKIGLANIVYNVKRLIVLERWAAIAL